MAPVSPVVHTEKNSEYWSQKRTQSGNIHSIILDVHAVKQSMLKLSFQSSQYKLDKNLTLSLLLP